ncbi:MAG: hypothetical protein HOY79_21300 [Streptomyces sp.]|nr:hypothetical protein [Streptomyces sp.]
MRSRLTAVAVRTCGTWGRCRPPAAEDLPQGLDLLAVAEGGLVAVDVAQEHANVLVGLLIRVFGLDGFFPSRAARP